MLPFHFIQNEGLRRQQALLALAAECRQQRGGLAWQDARICRFGCGQGLPVKRRFLIAAPDRSHLLNRPCCRVVTWSTKRRC
jgi:hypothetical protein